MEVFSDKGTMEFLTVASEYCAFVEKARKFSRKDFVTKLHKILALVYLKMTLLPLPSILYSLNDALSPFCLFHSIVLCEYNL